VLILLITLLWTVAVAFVLTACRVAALADG